MTTDLTPLLDGSEAERAIECAVDIATELSLPGGRVVDMWSTGPGLASGTTGIALFFAALSEVTGDSTFGETAAALVERAVAEVSTETRADPGLYGHTVGLGWALNALSGRLFEPDDGDPGIDDLVERLLTFDPWPGHYDLISGLVGLGVYWLSRLPEPRARGGLEQVVRHLSNMAETLNSCLTWFTAPGMFPGRTHQFPSGHYDVGFAHGVSGVVALLAESLNAGIGEAGPLLDGAVRWILDQKLGDQDGSRYPGLLGPGAPPRPTRLAWCYGDPGVALALTAAGRALGSAEIVAEAQITARGCVRQATTGMVEDAGLCHGSGGLAHVFNRLAHAHGDGELRDIARFWIDYTLDNRRSGPCAGFPQRNPAVPMSSEVAYLPSAGLLEGAAGVGLALLAATSSTRPWWDGFYLIAEL